MMDTKTARETLVELIDVASESMLERDEEVRVAVTAAIAGHHVAMIGEPGVAKSMLSRTIASGIDGARLFEILMARTTEPSELFGGKDIEAMKRGETKRNLAGSIADVEIAFLDEAFKAHSAILNSLLGVLNERRYANGAGGVVDVPLRFVVAASNEVPEEGDATLGAFFDRFLVRRRVVPIESDENFALLLRRQLRPMRAGVSSLAALDVAREDSRNVKLSDAAITALRAIVIACRQAGIAVSDRRAVAIGDFLRAAAWLDNRVVVDACDVGEVTTCLWSRIDQIATAEEIVKRCAPSWQNDARDIRRVIVEQREAVKNASSHRTSDAMLDALKPIARVLKDIDGDIDAKVQPMNADAARDLHREVTSVREELTRATTEAYSR